MHLNSSATETPAPPSSSSVTPGDSLPTLPFDLVVEILFRVPIKSLMQLQCVCKSWKSLISDHEFAKKHLHQSTTRRHLLVSSFTYASLEFIHMSYPLSSVFTEATPIPTALQLDYPLNSQAILVGSCHGIICFALDRNYALLWNPSIRKFTKLPSLDMIIPTPKGGYFTSYGFGYDHSTHTYKVVAVSYYHYVINGNRVQKTQVKVHTMGTNYWRRIQDFPRLPYCVSGKLVSGTLNWLETDYTKVIVSFDLETESYRDLLQPDYGEMLVAAITNLCVLRDCLCILCHSDTFSDVWLMKEYGNKDSWTKLFHVPHMGGVVIQDANFYPFNRALYVFKDDEVLLGFLHELVVYNSGDDTFKTLGIQKIDGWLFPEVYHESLISPCIGSSTP